MKFKRSTHPVHSLAFGVRAGQLAPLAQEHYQELTRITRRSWQKMNRPAVLG
jgi:hypothetical protein